MGVALAVGGPDLGGGIDAILAALESLDLREVVVRLPTRGVAGWRASLRSSGVAVPGVVARIADLEAGVATAARLRAGALVVEVGDGGGAETGGAREAAVDGLARRLHALVGGGVPLAVRTGGPGDLLDLEALGWLLGALPALSVWFDPARAEARARAGDAAEPLAWAASLARRCSGVFVQGLGPDGAGGAHPEHTGPDWRALTEMLPVRVPWTLDLAAGPAAPATREAVMYLRGLLEYGTRPE